MKRTLCLLLTCAPAFATAKEVLPRVTFVGELSQCVVARNPKIIQMDNAALVRADIEISQAIGSCGCTSAIAGYDVIAANPGLQVVSRGRIVLMEGGSKLFFLTTDLAELKSTEMKVSLHCAGSS